MSAGIAPSALVATLVVDGALAMIAGKVKGTAPVEGRALQPGERDRLGLKPGGLAIFYPAGEEGVFFDMNGSEATIFYNGGDCEQGIATFEAALKVAHPNTRYLGEVPNPNSAMMRSRGYEVDLGQGRLATIDASFPAGPGGQRQFAVRVFAKKRS